jgi:hypothetical protein
MKLYESETKFANNNLNHKEYRDSLDEMEVELHNLADELVDAQTEYLTNNGYTLIDIDGIEILASKSMSFQELHSSIQQMPSPDMKSDDSYALNYLVSPEDIQESRKSEIYMDIVEKRQDIIEEIYSLYNEFWNKEIKGRTESKDESIVYLMAGLDKDINHDTLSQITGYDESACINYTFNEEGIVIRK